MGILKFVTHSKKVIHLASRFGWLPGARYTNLRDVRNVDRVGFLDIVWQDYDFKKHLAAAKSTKPVLTVARDVLKESDLEQTLDEATWLQEYSDYVIIVPKAKSLGPKLNYVIPPNFILGYSVPSTYGGTRIKPKFFDRPTHLLGGRPDIQRQLANIIPVVSFDCNRFTIDARFGDYFNGNSFVQHPVGGYERCLKDSLRNITKLWKQYDQLS